METKITLVEPWQVVFNTSNLEEAEKIVRAVNSHDELLEAAKAMVAALNKQKYGERKEGQLEAFFALNDAIAKAEGK